MSRFHGFCPRKEDSQALEKFETTGKGKYGRLFPPDQLPPFTPSEESLIELGNAMQDPKPANNPDGDNKTVPAGYTYLGQFIDHDMTFDITPLQDILSDPHAVENFRNPMLDLDNLYGAGPIVQPYLYQFPDSELFLIGLTSGNPPRDQNIPTEPLPNDIPRVPSSLGLVADPRNDENLIIAQLTVAFLKFHNKVVEEIRNGKIKQQPQKSTFEQAREIVIWHYQWIILHDYLRRILDTKQLDLVLNEGLSFYQPNENPFVPVEFSVAAFRLGHSMIRQIYNYNRKFQFTPLENLFNLTARSGRQDDFFTVPIPNSWIIDWRRFFEIDPSVPVGFSRKLDPLLVDALKNLPNVPPPSSLAVRNLLRGRSLGLPSGQKVAEYMGFEPLTEAQMSEGRDGEVARKHNFHIESPLWYYILKEAQIQGDGNHLGQVGSRIVAEVFVGILKADQKSFLAQNPEWRPTLPAKESGTFTMVDLMNFVGDINPIGELNP